MKEKQTTLLTETWALMEEALRRALDTGTCSFKHKGTCIDLSERRPTGLDIEALVSKLYQKIARYPKSTAPRGPSKENWKLRRRPCLAENNKSPEVVLERIIIQAIEKARRDDWFNQCPTASGVFTRKGERCNIDLIHQISGKEFELIELKVPSNNPVFAAFEILRNGLLYLHARRSLIADYADKPLLRAKEIRLTVLAPWDFYGYKPTRAAQFRKYDLGWFERELSRAISRFAKKDCEMTFAFEVLPGWFRWKDLAKQRGVFSDEDLVRAIKERQPAFSG